jgi:uncharacterized membrane protein YhaH (DUF805 family)
MNEVIYQIKKYFVNYFDLTTRVNRKEFNFGILLYSILFIASMFLVTDVKEINNVLQTQVSELQYEAYEGRISQQDAAQEAMKAIAPHVPTLFMNFFALLLLPLYIRRLNDTFFHTIGFASPIVIVYLYDTAHTLFSLTGEFRLYDAMSFYTFAMTAVLCIWPTKTEETDGY